MFDTFKPSKIFLLDSKSSNDNEDVSERLRLRKPLPKAVRTLPMSPSGSTKKRKKELIT
jgi:hypothetical protein